MNKPKIRITLVEQKGTMGCHRGHKVGDSYDFDTERGNLCPMAMHVAFPYVDPESVKFILFCNQLSKQNWLSITLIAVFFQFPH